MSGVRILLLAGGLVVVGGVVWGAGSSAAPDQRRVLDSAVSPEGKLVLDRILGWEDLGDGEDEQQYVEFDLRAPSETALKGRPILIRPYYFDGDINSDVALPQAVFGKWRDARTVLIAEPAGRVDLTRPAYAGAVTLDYGFYSHDPDAVRDDGLADRDEGLADIVTKQAKITARRDRYGGCVLDVSADDGDIGSILLLLDRQQLVLRIDGSRVEPIRHVTSAALSSPWLASGQSIRQFQYRDFEGPNALTLRWLAQFGTRPSLDVAPLVKDMRDGALQLKIGFWLDRKELIFGFAGSDNNDALDTFSKCATALRP